MKKETKLSILKTIHNAGPKGADREMLDNLKAVIKSIENDEVTPLVKSEVLQDLEEEARPNLIPSFKRKAGRPPKRK